MDAPALGCFLAPGREPTHDPRAKTA